MSQLALKNSTAFFENNFVPFGEANLSIGSSPVLYGLSVYTVISASWNEKTQKLYIFRLKDHYDRLINSARIMDFQDFTAEWSYEKFEKTIFELLRCNDIREDVLVRVTAYVDELASGTKMHGLKNNLSAFVYPMGEILPLTGAHVCVSSWMRTPDNAIPSRAKVNGSYVNASLMKNEALLNGYDDAISLDEHGHVAEGTVANLFLVRDGVLITPGQSTDMLEGITRSSIISLAANLKIPVHERSVDRSELYVMDEAFLCGSSARITPVISIDKRQVGTGKIGPITQLMMQKYEDVQRGTTSDLSEWRLSIP